MLHWNDLPLLAQCSTAQKSRNRCVFRLIGNINSSSNNQIFVLHRFATAPGRPRPSSPAPTCPPASPSSTRTPSTATTGARPSPPRRTRATRPSFPPTPPRPERPGQTSTFSSHSRFVEKKTTCKKSSIYRNRFFSLAHRPQRDWVRVH